MQKRALQGDQPPLALTVFKRDFLDERSVDRQLALDLSVAVNVTNTNTFHLVPNA